MTRTVRQIAKKMADENKRKAEILFKQAQNDFSLARLQPHPRSDYTRLEGMQKQEKAKQLLRVASQLGKPENGGTGLGSTPKPVLEFR